MRRVFTKFVLKLIQIGAECNGHCVDSPIPRGGHCTSFTSKK